MLKLSQPNAEIIIRKSSSNAMLPKSTYVAFGAHPDDLEIWMYFPILCAYEQSDESFTGVTVTTGAGAPRKGAFENFSDDEIAHVREKEQRHAARVGKYAAMVQLGYSSAAVKDPNVSSTVDEIEQILLMTCPREVYTHYMADSHLTHKAVSCRVIEAIRRLPPDKRPEKLIGCEGWGGIDWVPDEYKVVMNVSGRHELAERLITAHQSQLAAKNYDIAVRDLRIANATFMDSHEVDSMHSVIFGVDMTRLVKEPDLDPALLFKWQLSTFHDDVARDLELVAKKKVVIEADA